MSDFLDKNLRILLGLVAVVDAGLSGATSVLLVRPRPVPSCTTFPFAFPFATVFGVTARPFAETVVVDNGSVAGFSFAAGGGGFSSMGESGGGGISVPSVREKFTGVSCGSSKRPFDLPLAGIVQVVDPSSAEAEVGNNRTVGDFPQVNSFGVAEEAILE